MTNRLPSLDSLRFFEAAARHSNFSKAASEIGITPAAMSQRMRDLQLDLGQRLFDRRGPAIKLTSAGERLAVDLTQVMQQVRSAVFACRKTNTIRLTATPTFASCLLVPMLAEMQFEFPDLAITLDVSTDIRGSEAFDISIRSGDGNWPGMSAQHLFDIGLTPMLSPKLASQIDLSSADQLPMLPLIPCDDWPRWFAYAGVAADSAPPEISVNRFPTQDLSAVAALRAQGIALLSPRLFSSQIEGGELIQPFARSMPTGKSYWLVHHQHQKIPHLKALAAWIVDRTKAVTTQMPADANNGKVHRETIEQPCVY